MLTIGNECAGYVEAVGESVTDYKPGMPVWIVHMPGYGAYAEMSLFDDKQIMRTYEKDLKRETERETAEK